MDVLEAIQGRQSIRGFRPDQVPKDAIARILTFATRAPSPRNMQAWEIYVVSGEALEGLRWENVAQLHLKGALNPEISLDKYEGKFRERQIDLAARLFRLMGIRRGDEAALTAWRERGYRFFDAPVGIILGVEKSVDRQHAHFMLGCLAQNICLAALGLGLGTCINNQGITYPDAVKKWVPVPESQRIAIGISLGYPDPDFPANRVETSREPLDAVVRWVGFE